MNVVWNLIILIVTISAPLLLIYKALNKPQPSTIGEVLSKDVDLMYERQKLMINAYERLALLCDRIQPDKLATRLQSPTLNAQELSQMMIVAIQQEFDHNITQQIFVSEPLWNIISISKDEALYEIIQITSGLSPNAPASELTQALMKHREKSKLNTAAIAIRTEAKEYVKL